MQLSRAGAAAQPAPEKTTAACSRVNRLPIAASTPMVASMSADLDTGETRQGSPERAAQISARCAADLEGGACSSPCGRAGVRR